MPVRKRESSEKVLLMERQATGCYSADTLRLLTKH